ncbi:MAG: adenosine deaminase family protein [Spirochaetales bacterium]|nr:adenosine deaminase family protein [Spirochaetales bacterium]
MQYNYSYEFLKSIPKTDLHVHLDGSLRVGTLIELAKEQGMELPSYSEDGLNDTVFKSHYNSLDEYLQGFGYTCAVMQTPDALERIAYEFAWDNWLEGVRYVECRFAPQLHVNRNQSMIDVLSSIDKGFKRAKNEINQNVPDNEPSFEYGLIVCAMRFFTEDSSLYYNALSKIHSYSNPTQLVTLASVELARAAVWVKQNTDIQLVGFDVAGSEYGHPAEHHEQAYKIIHNNFIHKTIHAGEAYGCESIFQAITSLHAERIGHGLFLFDENMIFSDKIKDKQAYIRNLVDYIANRRITIEVCLTSNMQTTPAIGDIRSHSLRRMLDEELSLSICTDNRLVSHTTVTDEYKLAADNFDISPKQLRDIVLYGFKRSFSPQRYTHKRDYVRKVRDLFDRLAAEYGIN